jgi:N-acetylmuramoyl-L-alanine amidase
VAAEAPPDPSAGDGAADRTRAASVTDLPLPGVDNLTPGRLEPNGDAATDGAATTGALSPVAAPALRPRPPPHRLPVIAIDPGHGGKDPGTVGINGVLEKEVTLDVARRLRTLIERTGRYEVVLTRDDDVLISLRERIERARRADAALFISVHADSIGDSGFRGASVYTLSDQASDAEAARLAAKENRADVIAGTDLSAHDEVVAGILIDLAQRVTNNKSIEFADVLASELADVTALVRNTRRFAGFVVLKSPDVPSVLLELGYLSNPTDATNLARPEYRDKMARSTVRAIDRYFATLDATL